MEEMRFMASAGFAAALLATVAWLADRRRLRRRNPDAVGFMPWTGLFFVALIAACMLLGIAVREWIALR